MMKPMTKPFLTVVTLCALQGGLHAETAPVVNSNITEAEVEASQKAWGQL